MTPRRGRSSPARLRRGFVGRLPPPPSIPEAPGSAPVAAVPGRALLVSNDRDILALGVFCLASAGYQTTTAPSAAEAIARLQWSTYELVVLDGALRSVSAIELLRRLRLRSTVTGPGASGVRNESAAVVILHSGIGGPPREDEERLAAYAHGADDVLPRGVSEAEFRLRCEAAVRRRQPPPSPPRTPASETQAAALAFASGPLRIEMAARQAWVSGEPVDLTWMEFELLAELAAHAGSLRTRDQLKLAVGGSGVGAHSRAIDVHVNRLRARLGVAGSLIETLRRAGYRLCRRPPTAIGHPGPATGRGAETES